MRDRLGKESDCLVAGRTVLLGCVTAFALNAVHLPVKTYTTADGLVHNSIHRVLRDSRGFLWFGTAEGISRFDGYSFTNYGTAEGLPHPNVFDMLETHSGVYWIATGGGLCRFASRKPSEPSGATFTVAPLPPAAGLEVRSLAEGHDGTLWVGTTQGLCRSVRRANAEAFELVELGIHPLLYGVTAVVEDDLQTLWIGTGTGLYRRWPDGRVERHRSRALEGPYTVQILRLGGQGRVLAGTGKGLLTLVPTSEGCSDERLYSRRQGLYADYVLDILRSADKGLWVVSLDGVNRLLPGGSPGGAQVAPHTSSRELGDFPPEGVAEDREGNVWIGLDGGGTARFGRNGLVSYTEADGLGSHDIVSIFEDARGQLFAVSRSRAGLFLNRFSGEKFEAIRLNIDSKRVSIQWRGHYQVIVAGTGRDWWAATYRGLARFANIRDPAELSRAQPKYYEPEENIFRLFQGRGGDLWISSQHHGANVVTIWSHQTGKLDRFPVSGGAPDLTGDRVQAYAEDRAGNVWLGLEHRGLWRRSQSGFRRFNSAEGAPGGSINWLHTDQAGHVWAGSSIAGASRIDQPESEHPSFVRYSTGQGLSSNEIQCITEDLSGRIYFGTARGVDRLDPVTGHVKHYTTADGLAAGELQTAFRDHGGSLWFGTQQGVSRLVPSNDMPFRAAPVTITGIRVEGVALPISPAGETEVSLPDLSPGRDQVQLDFVGLGFGAADVLQYQFLLEGTDDGWSAPTPQRSVIYAGLRPGSYRFLVRAINSDGAITPQPAWIAFTILRPIWLRWWFLAAAVATASLAGRTAWRYRERQLAALQRVRMRIATDLHDDIGSSLSQIAILSEVVRKADSQDTSHANAALDQIANVSRELVDSMSDIVWATDPYRDRLGDLAMRMRQFAGEVLGGSDIEFHLETAGIEAEQKLSANVRRQVYLVFKESVNNVIHHAGSTEVRVSVERQGGSLLLEVSDNGKGFEVARNRNGHGLVSMRERAASLGGDIEWTSSAVGTTVKMRVPLHV